MVNVRTKRCLHGTNKTKPSFIVEGKKTASFCRKHAGEGMVRTQGGRCSHGTRTARPMFNADGSKADKSASSLRGLAY